MNQGAALTVTSKPRKVGRPRKNYDDEIGAKYHYLRILLVYKRGRSKRAGPKVKARCLLCKRTTTPRLRDVRSGHTKACPKCYRSKVFKRNCQRVVDERLSDAQLSDIWVGHFLGRSREDLGRDFRWPWAIIDFAIRKYQTWIDALIESEAGVELLQAIRSRGEETDLIAIEYNLPIEAVRYVAKAVQNKQRSLALKEQRTDEDAEWVVQRIETRSRNWNEGHYPREFTPEELRLKKDGSVRGRYSDLYSDCIASLAISGDEGRRTPHERFIELAEMTFTNRTKRQKTVAIRKLKEEQDKREQFWVNQEGFDQMASVDRDKSEDDV